MNEHIIHILLIIAPPVISIIFLIKNLNLGKLRTFAALVLSFFILGHIMPVKQTFALHHQSENPSGQHPCCIPQFVDVPDLVVFEPFLKFFDEKNEAVVKEYRYSLVGLHFIRPPPSAF